MRRAWMQWAGQIVEQYNWRTVVLPGSLFIHERRESIMFALKNQVAKLAHINGREEKNVEEIAFDLKVTVEMHNTALNMFHDHMLDAFYKVDPDAAQQSMLEDVKHSKTALKFLKLGVLPWGHEIVGCAVTVAYGVGSDIELDDCKVDKFKIDLKEGGTVGLTFRIIAHPDNDEIGKLYSLLGSEITLSINPPAESP